MTRMEASGALAGMGMFLLIIGGVEEITWLKVLAVVFLLPLVLRLFMMATLG